jgi:hypothetical protein
MRHPLRLRNRSLGCFLAGLAMLAYGLSKPEATWSRVLDTPLGAIGLILAFGGGICALLLLVPAARHARLLNGKDALARWQVTPGRWAAFLAADAAINAEDPALANALSVRSPPPDGGVEVIVGRKAVLIDGSYHGLAGQEVVGVGIWPGPPECIVFRYVVPRDDGPALDARLRFPTAADGDPVGRHVAEWYDAGIAEMWARVKPGLALRKPRLSRAIALVVTGVCALASAWGYWSLRAPRPTIAAGLAAGIGTLLGMAAAVIALVTHLRLREP